MPWIELHITTSATHADEISHQLSECGAKAVTFQDAGDQPIYEPSLTTPRIWAETTVVGLFEHDQPLDEITQYLQTLQSQGHIQKVITQSIDDEDWVRRSLDSFHPLSFGQRLWICPSWQAPVDPSAVNVILDPGLAFGTGTHPTTALCLEWLDQHIVAQDTVIDFGCGSGILGIAAHQLGAKHIIAIDNDPQALTATLQNALQNNLLPEHITVQLAEKPIQTQADVVLANILAQPLLLLAEKLASLTKPHGFIVLSGILEEQADGIFNTYSAWFDMDKPVIRDQWVRLSGVKRI